MAKSKEAQEVESEEEEEYEVNKILNHKRKGSSLQYEVSWIGYSKDDDCWIEEQDAEGAKDALDAYWKTCTPAKQLERYAAGSAEYKKAKAALANGSTPAKKAPSTRAAAPSSSKSKRSAPANYESESEEEEEEEETVVKPKAKAASKEKKAPAAKKAAAAEPAQKKKRESKPKDTEDSPELEANGEVEGDDDPAVIDGHQNFKHEEEYETLKDWEGLVEKIDTVERADDGVLKLLIVWAVDSTYSWVASDLVRARCPQKVIDFYEGHLKFSVKEDNDEPMETDE